MKTKSTMGKKHTLSSILSILLILSIFLTGCSRRDIPEKAPENTDKSTSASDSSSSGSGEKLVRDLLVDESENVSIKKEENSDTIGWLKVPNTFIDDVVVLNQKNNDYYLRRGFDKKYSFEGVYYADYRSKFGDGSRESLPLNTVIYGHALTDDPDHENYDVKFGSIHNLRELDYIQDTPYIFFSTEKENFAFEIFALFVANANNLDFPYNYPDMEPEKFIQMVRNEVLPRSIWTYKDFEVKDSDKFITLSTCIYELEDGTQTGYPKTWYRMAVMGRLVDGDAPALSSTNPIYNENALVDVDTYPN